ncbi:MAG: hypothetical protein MR458_03550 [Erysipelotrichaceae bacterium]|nr:hypothetical protein [Erysipelotrichaceae bacterium]
MDKAKKIRYIISKNNAIFISFLNDTFLSNTYAKHIDTAGDKPKPR